MNDLKFAFRQLLKNTGFTAVAVLTLALGIGANTTIFTVINTVLLRSLPVRNPEALVQVVVSSGGPVPTIVSHIRFTNNCATMGAACRVCLRPAAWGSRTG